MKNHPPTRAVRTVAAMALSIALLCGCGTKPNNVAAPPGAPDTHYPGTYPDPATDPQPTAK